MTPKEKAEELHLKYFRILGGIWKLTYENAKDCAIIAVDEIAKYNKDKVYWQLVKEEIEKIMSKEQQIETK